MRGKVAKGLRKAAEIISRTWPGRKLVSASRSSWTLVNHPRTTRAVYLGLKRKEKQRKGKR